MTWTVIFQEDFDGEFEAMAEDVQDELLAHAKLLQQFGPTLGRPTVDTLNGSKYPNMKELRFSCSQEVWRVAFAFDPKRHAILLSAGDKAGKNQQRFYAQLITKADERYGRHVASLKAEAKAKGKGKRHAKKS